MLEARVAARPRKRLAEFHAYSVTGRRSVPSGVSAAFDVKD